MLTLHCAPGVLPGPHLQTVDHDLLSATHNCEGDLFVHLGVELQHSLIIGWETVDVNSTVPQLFNDLLDVQKGMEGGREVNFRD